ncbi:MAG: cupin domain-containing protein [Deltaproteobacteria bacterium]|nr:cupin domain-containing protein [Deltaproteobacteria bacterium]
MNDAAFWIERLDLRPHPEGGYFRETYRAAARIAASALPPGFGGDRAFSTAIYFLLTRDAFSAFHRIRSDEVWHSYAGQGVTLAILEGGGGGCLTIAKLGRDPARGELPQVVVPAGAWFAAEVASGGAYALVGCTVAPGFDFAEFELADRAALLAQHPRHRGVIERLTRVG